MKQTFTISGQPLPLKRPRLGRGHVYSPSAMAMERAGFEILSQQKHKTPLEGPIFIEITFFMPIPAKHSLKRRSLYIGKHHTTRPDLDNLIKFVLDSAKSLYKDDAQIALISAEKIYSEEPRTEFTIESME